MPALRRKDYIDKKVSNLIEDVQSYSKPEGKYPTPPIDEGSERRFVPSIPIDFVGPDRSRPPNWFEPQETPDEGMDRDSLEIPAIPGDMEIPVPSPEEEYLITREAWPMGNLHT